MDKTNQEKAEELRQEGIEHYKHWDIERAIEAFNASITLDDTIADSFLNLAQSYVRLGDYDATRKALGEFIHLETNQILIDRFEAMFGSAMDTVETGLTTIMVEQDVPLEVIGAGIQMWFEFRLTMGRKTINLAGVKPKAWAAALDYTVRKVNFHEVDTKQISKWYKISPEAVVQHHKILLKILDIMPCDYRYFRGLENPLDKLVDAALMLEELEERFYEI